MDTINDIDDLRQSSVAVLTRTEVARLMRIDVRTVGYAIENGDLPSIKVGRRILIPRKPLLDLLEGRPAA